MALLRRVLLPLLIAIAVLAQLSVGIAGASSIRADHRHAAAVARERRDVAAYQVRLVALTTQVFDAVQPLQDALDAFAKPSPTQHASQFDVILRSGALEALKRTGTALAAVEVPRSLRARSKALQDGLDQLESAAVTLKDAAGAGASADVAATVSDAFDYLSTAETVWVEAVTDLLGDKHPVPLPSVGRDAAHGRTAPTHGSYIQQADDLCGAAETAGLKVGRPSTAAGTYTRQIHTLRLVSHDLNAHLLAVQAPAEAASRAVRLQTLIHGEAALFDTGFTGIETAVARHDAGALRAAEASFREALRISRDLSDAFRSYGVSVCASYFSVSANALAGQGTAT
jgi:hypothetical protein